MNTNNGFPTKQSAIGMAYNMGFTPHSPNLDDHEITGSCTGIFWTDDNSNSLARTMVEKLQKEGFKVNSFTCANKDTKVIGTFKIHPSDYPIEVSSKEIRDSLIYKLKGTVGYNEAESKESYLLGANMALNSAEDYFLEKLRKHKDNQYLAQSEEKKANEKLTIITKALTPIIEKD